MTNAMGAIPMEENQWRKSNGGKPVEQRLMEEIPMEEKEEMEENPIWLTEANADLLQG